MTETGVGTKDLSPTTPHDRQWRWTHFAALWIGMAHNVPTWLLAGSMIELGLNWWQALLAIAGGNFAILLAILLNSHGGAKYGVPFPILARATFGYRGAILAAFVRACFAAVWFGIDVHIGGHALLQIVSSSTTLPGVGYSLVFLGQSLYGWLAFLSFLFLNLVVLKRGMQALKRFELWAAPTVLLAAAILCLWAVGRAGGAGPVFEHGSAKSGANVALIAAVACSAMGFWAPLALNASDFTRFSKTQRDHLIGQAVGLPVTMVVFSIMGLVTSSATALIFGRVIWDPTEISMLVGNNTLTVLILCAIVLATLSVNVPANLVGPGYDLAMIAPRRLNLWRGALVTAVFSIAILPWNLLRSAEAYVFDWLGTYCAILGPFAGILACDYWLVHRATLHVESLFDPKGIYSSWKGFSVPAVAALLLTAPIPLIGKALGANAFVSNYGWATGFLLGALLHFCFTRLLQQRR